MKIDRHFVLYLVIGLSSVVIDFVVFSAGRRALGIHPALANIMSVSVAIMWSFSLNTWLNFGVTDRLARRFLAFFSVSVGGMALSTVLILVFAVWLSVNAELVKAVTLPVVAILQYSLNRKFSFAASNAPKEMPGSVNLDLAERETTTFGQATAGDQ